MKTLFNSKESKGLRISSQEIFTSAQLRMSDNYIQSIAQRRTADYIADEIIKNPAFFMFEKEKTGDNDSFYIVTCKTIVLTEEEYLQIIKEAYKEGRASTGIVL